MMSYVESHRISKVHQEFINIGYNPISKPLICNNNQYNKPYIALYNFLNIYKMSFYIYVILLIIFSHKWFDVIFFVTMTQNIFYINFTRNENLIKLYKQHKYYISKSTQKCIDFIKKKILQLLVFTILLARMYITEESFIVQLSKCTLHKV